MHKRGHQSCDEFLCPLPVVGVTTPFTVSHAKVAAGQGDVGIVLQDLCIFDCG